MCDFGFVFKIFINTVVSMLLLNKNIIINFFNNFDSFKKDLSCKIFCVVFVKLLFLISEMSN